MRFIVKAFDSEGSEMEFENTAIGEEKEVSFENEEAAKAFIEGIKISLPNTWQYRIIPKEDEKR
ncbi:hypothetical protein [Bacillus badius]|uniref:Phage protein n=1 Tax=Bacillus badius TaxID=1455 RepID=A0ABR5APD2_BACBA|nr:hypothetical protein [Bacillus badius]KIL74198.1 hypothetical protein SD77_2853 [Bacillus badius]KZN99319.1 hypothetical protein A4244_05630 [Bacillus badius]KZR59163.1 hypothetical protein A3781_14350 [Bacillus badius]MED0668590.1 hypothetical protein [Bacillus badius]MED4717145.1 hypothetical protein [Bacillus badius]